MELAERQHAQPVQIRRILPASYVPADAIYTPPSEPLINFDTLGIFPFLCCFAGIFIGLPALGIVNANKRKLQYLPPKISIEGQGIKRGLTAVEAAILMEQPLDKVMTMILFGVIKKEAAEVVKRDPLELSFAKEQPGELHQYEKDFLKAFGEKTPGGRRKLLQEMTVTLVRSVSNKIKGFSRKETVSYYKSIMEKAWTQVEAAATPEVKSQKYDENLSSGPCSIRITMTAPAVPSRDRSSCQPGGGTMIPPIPPGGRPWQAPRASH